MPLVVGPAAERTRLGRPPDPPPMLLDWEQAARALSISVRHLRKLHQERRIGSVKVGRLVRFRPTDLEHFINQHATEPQR